MRSTSPTKSVRFNGNVGNDDSKALIRRQPSEEEVPEQEKRRKPRQREPEADRLSGRERSLDENDGKRRRGKQRRWRSDTTGQQAHRGGQRDSGERRDGYQDGKRGKRSPGTRRPRASSPASDASDETVDLPDRFDKQGRKRPTRDVDPLTSRIEGMLAGQGRFGKLLQRFTDQAR